uniref:Unannotated protein n=1 Tax=freshwater metagenome TaxID=449393 RepID=A0A6J5Z2Y2_9ZZZZ
MRADGQPGRICVGDGPEVAGAVALHLKPVGGGLLGEPLCGGGILVGPGQPGEAFGSGADAVQSGQPAFDRFGQGLQVRAHR